MDEGFKSYKIVNGSINNVMATFYNDLAVSSGTKEGRDFYTREARYFIQVSKNDSDEKKYKGTISKIN